MLRNKNIVLGITGGIAAYKAADLASKLTQAGATVDVVMTEAATKFISPMTLRAVTNRPVVTGMFEISSEWSIEHVSLADRASVIVITPSTADIIAKLASGIADEMILSTVLATKAPVIIAPAMDVNMFENRATQENINALKSREYIIVEPELGRLASGKMGLGRLAGNDKIIGTINKVLGRNGDLAGKQIIVTAGGTQEPIDPVRVITNRSSGKMGYALAEAARDRGANVKLITASFSMIDPIGMDLVRVSTAEEMRDAVLKSIEGADVLIMAAAVSDYRPKTISREKIKKTDQTLTLELERTKDILSEITGRIMKIGFAAESEDITRNAIEKLKRKRLDLIVANDITDPSSGFGVDTNKVTIIDSSTQADALPLLTKREVAEKVLDKIVEKLNNSPNFKYLS